jgi:hypothetical protein
MPAMNEPRPVPGATAPEQATRLAGALAELGVTEVVLITASGERVLRARETDLPGEIAQAAAEGALLKCPSLGLVVTLSLAGVLWSTDDADPAPSVAKSLDAG